MESKCSQLTQSKISETLINPIGENLNPNLLNPVSKLPNLSPIKSQSKTLKSVTKSPNLKNPVEKLPNLSPIKSQSKTLKSVSKSPNLKTPVEKLPDSSTIKSPLKTLKFVTKSPNLKNPVEKLADSVKSPLKTLKFVTKSPNLKNPVEKLPDSPSIESQSKTRKSFFTNPNVDYSPKNRIRERKFVVAKRNLRRERENSMKSECSCKEKTGEKCLCLAYESLRASQDEFFKPRDERDERELGENGKVMSLVKAFERLKTTPEPKEERELEGREKKGGKSDGNDLSLSFCESGFLGSKSLVSSSLDSSGGSFTFRSKGGCCAGRRSRRNSTELSGIFGGRRWRKKQQLRATRPQPFKLLTEQRGRMKEEDFFKKLQEMAVEEQKQRIPIAQGLPWTTDEPENLVKPHVKEITIPVDLVLHSDVRAVDRADFDQQVTEKEAFIEQWRMERERQQKLAEEEEIKRLRKELIPKAQPMPYFDRPFIPKRSEKDPTIPREPKFHIPQHHKKIKSCLSWNDFSSYQ